MTAPQERPKGGRTDAFPRVSILLLSEQRCLLRNWQTRRQTDDLRSTHHVGRSVERALLPKRISIHRPSDPQRVECRTLLAVRLTSGQCHSCCQSRSVTTCLS